MRVAKQLPPEQGQLISPRVVGARHAPVLGPVYRGIHAGGAAVVAHGSHHLSPVLTDQHRHIPVGEDPVVLGRLQLGALRVGNPALHLLDLVPRNALIVERGLGFLLRQLRLSRSQARLLRLQLGLAFSELAPVPLGDELLDLPLQVRLRGQEIQIHALGDLGGELGRLADAVGLVPLEVDLPELADVDVGAEFLHVVVVEGPGFSGVTHVVLPIRRPCWRQAKPGAAI